MDLSAKLLREVEFRTSLRGYDTDEVDEFLEKVAVAVEELQEKMRQLAYRAERAERAVSDRAAEEDDDSIRRTLVLAQRTADMAVREAQEQAAVLMDTARSESEKLLGDAREEAQRLSSEAQRRHSDDMARLHSERASVNAELKELSELLENERRRLTDSLRVALGLVEKTLTPSKEMAKRRTATPPQPASDEDDIEAQIDEDAAAAAPSLPLLDEGDDEDEAGHASLAAVPPLDESGPPTQAWHPDSMSIFSSGNDSFFGTEAGSGQHHFGPLGSDWIA
jgi:cell division initiation protein